MANKLIWDTRAVADGTSTDYVAASAAYKTAFFELRCSNAV
ncbi:hypothetical protein [Neisseria animaloris]|nr:hypothetical protein [Neisseria animaloris]